MAALISCSLGECGGRTPSGSAPAHVHARQKTSPPTPHVVIGTEKADEAIVLEGAAEEIKDRSVWKQVAQIYNNKYGGDVEPLLMASDGCVFRVTPQLAFGQDEHAEDFADAVTRWRFQE
jgi:hypothetical protein